MRVFSIWTGALSLPLKHKKSLNLDHYSYDFERLPNFSSILQSSSNDASLAGSLQ